MECWHFLLCDYSYTANKGWSPIYTYYSFPTAAVHPGNITNITSLLPHVKHGKNGFFSRTLQAKFLKNVGSNKPARQRNRDVSGGYLVWKCQSWRTVFKTNRGNSSLASRVIIIDKPFLTLGWKSRAAGCIFDSSYLLLNANFESKMVINRYLRCLFGHKKVIVDILRSSFIGSLTALWNGNRTVSTSR